MPRKVGIEYSKNFRGFSVPNAFATLDSIRVGPGGNMMITLRIYQSYAAFQNDPSDILESKVIMKGDGWEVLDSLFSRMSALDQEFVASTTKEV